MTDPIRCAHCGFYAIHPSHANECKGVERRDIIDQIDDALQRPDCMNPTTLGNARDAIIGLRELLRKAERWMSTLPEYTNAPLRERMRKATGDH